VCGRWAGLVGPVHVVLWCVVDGLAWWDLSMLCCGVW